MGPEAKKPLAENDRKERDDPGWRAWDEIRVFANNK